MSMHCEVSRTQKNIMCGPMEEGCFVVIETTIDRKRNARRIAKALITQKLAACVQVLRVRSFFAWEGALREVKEYKVVVKTLESLCGRAENAIQSLHSYKVPEIVVCRTSRAAQSYMEWIENVLATEGAPPPAQTTSTFRQEKPLK
eukprot:jgi/Antlo1/2467/2145